MQTTRTKFSLETMKEHRSHGDDNNNNNNNNNNNYSCTIIIIIIKILWQDFEPQNSSRARFVQWL